MDTCKRGQPVILTLSNSEHDSEERSFCHIYFVALQGHIHFWTVDSHFGSNAIGAET